MQIITRVVGIVKKGDTILMRKKPAGAGPYKESWYLFGGALNLEQTDPEQILQEVLQRKAGIEIRVTEHAIWDTEIKPDDDGKRAFFIYLYCFAEYVLGELTPGEGVEKLEWALVSKLPTYDLVPPSRKLFERLGYIQPTR